MKDCHIHTTVSHDGISQMAEYLPAAKQMGIDELTFTEHYDLYDGLITDLHTIDDMEYEKIYRDLPMIEGVRTNFGIEIGLQPDLSDKIRALVKRHDFDFIIGSSHITCKTDMALDPGFFEGYTRHEAYNRYFGEVLQNVRMYGEEFDVYGHLDYVVRYGGYAEKKIDADEFRDILDEILLLLIRQDKGIEINTSGIRYGLGAPHPNIDILKRYKALGGRIVTVGSDAHKTADLGRDLDVAVSVLREAGFDAVAVYRKRMPEMIGLTDFEKRSNG